MTDRANLKALARLALADATGGRALNAKVRALVRLAQAERQSPISKSRVRAELQAIIGTELVGGRALESAVRAVEALERLDAPRPRARKAVDPRRRAPTRFWPYDGSMPDLAGFEELDAEDTIATRNAWRRRLTAHGPA